MQFTNEFKKPLLSGYSKLLGTLGIMTDADGLTYVEEGGTWLPMTMDKRRLVLPTNEWLRDPNWEATIPFHPFSEHVLKGKKSLVLEKTCRIVNLRLNRIIGELLMTLAAFAVDTAAQTAAGAEQKSYLRLIPDVNAKTFTDFKKFIAGHVDGSAEKSFISIYLKRGGTILNEKYNNTAVVTSPARKALGAAEPIIFDYKFSSKRNRDYLLVLLDYLLPKLTTDVGYTVGSNAPIAPYFVTLCTSYSDIMDDLNRQLVIFSEINPDLASLVADMSWLSIIDDSADALKQIHALADNQGENEEGDVRIQSAITAKEREREAAREQRTTSKSGRNQYLERPAAKADDRYEPRRRDERDDLIADEPVTGWRKVAERRDDDRYYDDRGRGRDDRDDRYRDRDRDYDRRDSRDRYEPRGRGRDDRDYDRDRGRDSRDRYERDDRDRGYDRDRRDTRDTRYERDDRRGGPTTASGIPLDVGTPTRGRRY